ncbi:S8 family serine peptidase [Dactylosporangium sucinum]|uniref:Uncharacterized protein n=1 Tax=Dactylosporangium sucinum TaxID=1424081 RepID=A0A917U190_9ACTN|nr:S8 family serine peptidase [Dactylosporangium sucinum]GGM51157.1 hypothetical protein GCM10007977_061200 [Dactylosporangium sucinum]
MIRAVTLGLATLAATTAVLGAGLPAWAEGAIRGEVANAEANSFIVVLKDAAAAGAGDATAARAAVSARAKGLTARFGGTVTHEYSATIRGFAVEHLSDEQARRLAGDPAVDYVQRNLRFHDEGTQDFAPWGLDRLDWPTLSLDQRYKYPNTASDVTVYVVDSGIAIDHPEFEGRASYGPNFRQDGHGPGDSSDCRGHGTHVAGTVGSRTYGVAKEAKLVSVRMLDCNGHGEDAEALAAAEWVTTHAKKPAVVNFSVGTDGRDWAFEAAVKASIASGLLWVVSAGNAYQDACLRSPGAITEALVVGASDATDNGAWFSNYGGCVDLYAPGVDIRSVDFQGTWISYNGTSMAAPHVAGAAALILQAHPAYTAGQVHNAIVQSSSTKQLRNLGPGSPNKLLQVRQSDPPTIAATPTTLYNQRSGTTEVFSRLNNGELGLARYEQGWTDWSHLPMPVQGDPALVQVPGNGYINMVVRLQNNGVGYNRDIGYGWSTWHDLGGITVAGSPKIIYNPRFGTVEIYVRTTENRLAFRYFANEHWSPNWVDLGGSLAGDPALLYNPRFGTTEAYVRNSDGRLMYKYYSNGWSDWIDKGGSIADGATPAVLFNPRFGTTEVYVRTAAGKLSYIYYANGWSSWKDLGGTLASDPALLYNPRFGSTEAYVRTATGAIQYRYYANDWSSWTDLGSGFTDNPSVIFNPRWGTTEVYARTTGGHANYRYYVNGWSGWNDISA